VVAVNPWRKRVSTPSVETVLAGSLLLNPVFRPIVIPRSAAFVCDNVSFSVNHLIT
jgi:hypothetical protein